MYYMRCCWMEGREGRWYKPGDAAAELSEALIECQQLAKGGEALRHYGRQVAHVIHQLPLRHHTPKMSLLFQT